MPGNRDHRVRSIELRVADIEGDRIPCVVSSEEPVDRGDYFEVLSHNPGDIDMRRAPLPLLSQHDHRQLNVGVVEDLRVEGRKLRGMARFGSGELAQQLLRDVKDGIVRNLSVGYRIVKAIEELGSVVRFAWQPLEVSAVSVPADSTAGFFRSLIPLEGNHMNTNTENTQDLDHQTRSQQRGSRRSEAEQREAVREINALASQFNIPNHRVSAFIDERGFDTNGFRQLVTDSLRDHGKLRPSEEPELGMTGREMERYSVTRAVRALTDPMAKRDAGFEIECSRAYAQKIGREPQGLFIPFEALQTRDLTVGTPSDGGYLRPTDHLANQFVDYLRKRSFVSTLGATILSGLNGNVSIPTQTGSTAAYWVAENGAVTESQPAFGQISLTPKTVGTYTDYSRKMLLQASPEIEQLVRRDLAGMIAVEIDRAAIHGSGASNQPAGILNTSGVGSVALGANGAAPTWDAMLQLEESIALANADIQNMAYMTNAKVRRKLQSTLKVSGDAGAGWIWEPMAAQEPGWGRIGGYRAVSTNQVPSNLTKGASSGVCSAVILGNWSDLLIGMWGGLDLLLDPYTGGTAGTHRIVALQDVDVALRRAVSFAVILDALTT